MTNEDQTRGMGNDPTVSNNAANLSGSGQLSASNKISLGYKLTGIGIVILVIGVLGIVVTASADFPGVRIVGFLVLLVIAAGIATTARGATWLAQGLAGSSKEKKN